MIPYVGWLTSCQNIRSSWLIAKRSICLLNLLSSVCTDITRFGTFPEYQIDIYAVFSLQRVTLMYCWGLRYLFLGKKTKWGQRDEVYMLRLLCIIHLIKDIKSNRIRIAQWGNSVEKRGWNNSSRRWEKERHGETKFRWTRPALFFQSSFCTLSYA